MVHSAFLDVHLERHVRVVLRRSELSIVEFRGIVECSTRTDHADCLDAISDISKLFDPVVKLRSVVG